MSDEHSSPIIKAATNEWSLMLYRLVTGLCALIITFYVMGTRDEVKSIATDLAAFKLNYETRVARIEGSYGEIRSVVDASRTRIASADNDIRSIWNRIYDMASKLGSLQAK